MSQYVLGPMRKTLKMITMEKATTVTNQTNMDYYHQTIEAKKIARSIHERLSKGQLYNNDNKTDDVASLLTSPEKVQLELLIRNNDVSKTIIDSFDGSPDRPMMLASLFNDMMKTINFYVALRAKLTDDVVKAQLVLDKFNAGCD